MSVDPVEAFIARWQDVTASELATAQSFVIELCRLLDLPEPHHGQDYMFERPVTFHHSDGGSSAGRIDCYRRGCFVLEAKKLKAGADGVASRSYDDSLLRARSQAENYARALPAGEGRPPFVIVVDVGNVIELYAEFSQSGGTYLPFPDPRSHRIRLADLRDEAIRKRLAAVWREPLSARPDAPCRPRHARDRRPPRRAGQAARRSAAMRRRPSPASSPAACSACSPRMSA
jgi:hypothetical protein